MAEEKNSRVAHYIGDACKGAYHGFFYVPLNMIQRATKRDFGIERHFQAIPKNATGRKSALVGGAIFLGTTAIPSAMAVYNLMKIITGEQ